MVRKVVERVAGAGRGTGTEPQWGCREQSPLWRGSEGCAPRISMRDSSLVSNDGVCLIAAVAISRSYQVLAWE